MGERYCEGVRDGEIYNSKKSKKGLLWTVNQNHSYFFPVFRSAVTTNTGLKEFAPVILKA